MLPALAQAAETNSQHSGISGDLPLPGNDGGEERKSEPAEDDDAVSEAVSKDVSESEAASVREEAPAAASVAP